MFKKIIVTSFIVGLMGFFVFTAQAATPNFLTGLTSNGVGIGTTAPGVKLDILNGTQGSLVYSMFLHSGYYQDGSAIGIGFGSDGNASYAKGGIVYDPTGYGGWNRGDIKFLQRNSGDSVIAGLSDAVMTIKNTGSVGIGTTNPSTKLEVGNYLDAFKNIITVASQYQYEPEFNFKLGQTGTGYQWVGAVISSGDDGNYNGKISFKTANGGRDVPTTKMTIKANGNIGIGNTNPGTTLDIVSANNTSIYAGSKIIGNVGLPSAASDAATKGYVDSSFTTLSGTSLGQTFSNIKRNGGFESNDLSGWVGAGVVTSSYAHSGTYSLRMNAGTSVCNEYTYEDFDAKQNTGYSLSGWIKTISETANSAIFIAEGNGPGCSQWNRMVNAGVTGTNNWTQKNIENWNSSNCTKVRIGFTKQYCNSSGDSYFDDLMVTEGYSPKSYSAKPIADSYNGNQWILGSNVGIGITNPAAKLDISSSINASGSDLYGIRSSVALNDPGMGYNEYGGYFLAKGTSAANSYGVYGKTTNTNTDSDAIGVYGESPSIGVYGYSSGSGYGVYGYSSTGYGIIGQSGSGLGVYGYSSTGFGIYSNAPKNYFTGSIGIGTNAPAGKLNIDEPTGTINGPAQGSLVIDHENSGGASSIVFRSASNRGSDYGFIQFQDAPTVGAGGESNRLILGTSNDADDHLLLMPSGNVGIGVTTPGYKLDVSGYVNASSGLCISGTCKTSWPNGVVDQDGSRYATDFNTLLATGFYNGEGTPANSPVNYGQLITARGADTGLQIAGGYSNDNLFFRGWWSYGAVPSDFGPWRTIIHSGNIGSQSVANSDTVDSMHASQFFQYTGWISAPGADANNLPGNRSAFTYSNNAPLTGPIVNFDAGGYGLQLNSNYGNGTAISYRTRNGDAGAWNAWRGFVTADASGNVNLGTGSITASSFQYSDQTLKKNIETIDNPLSKILQLRGVTFNWKKDNSAGVGVIAQEVEKVYPELVKTDDQGIKSVQYSSLVAPLIEAVKAQQKEINNLEARIIILEHKK